VIQARLKKTKMRVGLSIVGVSLEDRSPGDLGLRHVSLLFESECGLTLVVRRLRDLSKLDDRPQAEN